MIYVAWFQICNISFDRTMTAYNPDPCFSLDLIVYHFPFPPLYNSISLTAISTQPYCFSHGNPTLHGGYGNTDRVESIWRFGDHETKYGYNKTLLRSFSIYYIHHIYYVIYWLWCIHASLVRRSFFSLNLRFESICHLWLTSVSKPFTKIRCELDFEGDKLELFNHLPIQLLCFANNY